MNNESTANRSTRNVWISRINWVILALIALWVISQWQSAPLLKNGTSAPAWQLPLATSQASSLSLAQLKGKVVVLDFWSTTCPPCLRGMPELNDLFHEMKDQSVVVVGVASGGESLASIKAFANERKIDYPLLADSGEVGNSYKVVSLPTLYIISAVGKIVDSHVGYWPMAQLRAAVQDALAEK